MSGEAERAAEQVAQEMDLGVGSPDSPGAEGAENVADAEGAELADSPTMGSPSEGSTGLLDGLFSTSPSPSLESVESPFRPELADKQLMRGIQKLGGIDGVPAIADIALGAVGILMQLDGSSSEESGGGGSAVIET